MYIEFSDCRGGQKFVETKVVRRNSIGRDLVPANSCTPYIRQDVFYLGVEVIERNNKKCRIYAAEREIYTFRD